MWFSDFNCCSFHDTFQEASPEPIGYPSVPEKSEGLTASSETGTCVLY